VIRVMVRTGGFCCANADGSDASATKPMSEYAESRLFIPFLQEMSGLLDVKRLGE
jgi:hypothetical protein